MAKLEIVGVGPGSPDYVTPAARKAVSQAQVVIGAHRSLNLFAADIKGEILVLTAKNLNDTLKHAEESIMKGKNVALLSTGDPGFSGLLHTVSESGFFKPDQVSVVPGVSSIQACAARLNIGWDNTLIFTFHDKVFEDEKEKLVSAVKCGRTILLLPNSRGFAPKNIASFLIDLGTDRETPVYICENLTLENEKITCSTLGKVSEQTFDSLCVMVIKQTA
ncbi:MAG: precorrin-6y C5,15-methyltransferase (decarboxylating) subunit CbiE [Bacillota bacterium]